MASASRESVFGVQTEDFSSAVVGPWSFPARVPLQRTLQLPMRCGVGLIEWFEPRNPRLAKTILFVLTWVAAGVTIVFTLAVESVQTRTDAAISVAGCALLLVLVTVIRLANRPARWLWAGYPLAAVALIAVLDLGSRDASVTAQVYFFFPALYAGAQLRRQAAIAVCAAAVVGEAVVTLTLLPTATAVIDLCFVATALITSAGLLLHSGEHTAELIATLEHQAAVDPLTGLLTRRVLDRAVSSALEGAAGEGGTALLLMDVDRFKTINDVHGHPAGDAVLQDLAKLLLGLHRRGDVVSRMGGDELAILMPGCSLRAALVRAEDILLEVRAHTFDVTTHTLATDAANAAALPVSLSIGVAHLPTHAADLRALYAAADAALYRAKQRGRDQVAASRTNAGLLT
jgi:diguanylate cyclase (GGDEF)-like protein